MEGHLKLRRHVPFRSKGPTEVLRNNQGIGIKGKEFALVWQKKGNGAGLAWESQSHCFADKFGKPYTHSYGTDTQHDYSQGSCRTMLSIIIKLE